MTKYDITNIKHPDFEAYRIRALNDIPGVVSQGELGGYVETGDQLSHAGICWVSGDAVLREWAIVKDHALVGGKAVISGRSVVEDQAIVGGTAYLNGAARVSDFARVSNSTKITEHAQIGGSARIYGEAVVNGYTIVKGKAQIFGKALVGGNAAIRGHARIFDHAVVVGDTTVSEHAQIFGYATVSGNALIRGYATVRDNAHILSGEVEGNAKIEHGNVVRGHAILTGMCTLQPEIHLSGCDVADGVDDWVRKYQYAVGASAPYWLIHLYRELWDAGVTTVFHGSDHIGICPAGHSDHLKIPQSRVTRHENVEIVRFQDIQQLFNPENRPCTP